MTPSSDHSADFEAYRKLLRQEVVQHDHVRLLLQDTKAHDGFEARSASALCVEVVLTEESHPVDALTLKLALLTYCGG